MKVSKECHSSSQWDDKNNLWFKNEKQNNFLHFQTQPNKRWILSQVSIRPLGLVFLGVIFIISFGSAPTTNNWCVAPGESVIILHLDSYTKNSVTLWNNL